MPKVLPASRSVRGLNNARAVRLRRFAKPSNMDRLLSALYAVFEEQGDDWIDIDEIHKKVEEEATRLGETLGKRSALYRQSCLHTLRRNHYIEYKLLKAHDDSNDHIRLTKDAKRIFEAVRDTLVTSGEHTDGDQYKMKCDSLRRKIQPQSRRLPTRSELDRENFDLEQENSRLVEENGILRGELEGLREPSTSVGADASEPTLHSLERQASLSIADTGEPELAFTASMYANESTRPPSPTILMQPLSRHNSLHTPVRQPSFQQNTASFYPTPESPQPNRLARQETHLLSPVSPVLHLSRTPSAYIMPGTLDEDSFDDGEQGERAMNIDFDIEDNEQPTARAGSPDFSRRGSIAGTPSRDLSTSGSKLASAIQPLCPGCVARRKQEENERPTEDSHSCQECGKKMQAIEDYEMVIEEQKGHIQDLKSVIDDHVHMLVEKAKEIRNLKVSLKGLFGNP